VRDVWEPNVKILGEPVGKGVRLSALALRKLVYTPHISMNLLVGLRGKTDTKKKGKRGGDNERTKASGAR